MSHEIKSNANYQLCVLSVKKCKQLMVKNKFFVFYANLMLQKYLNTHLTFKLL